LAVLRVRRLVIKSKTLAIWILKEQNKVTKGKIDSSTGEKTRALVFYLLD